MDKFKMYLREIENQKQCLQSFIKKRGYIENLGQIQYSEFRDKINSCDELSYAQKSDLASRFSEMIDNL